MKSLFSTNGIQILIVFLLIIFGCEKQENQPSAINHLFSGIIKTDEDGNREETWGTDDGDWGVDQNWNDEEYSLLSFPDTVNLDGTFVKDTTGWNNGTGIHERPENIVIVYPNPTADKQRLTFKGIGFLKFKAIIVDQYFNSISTFVSKDSITHFDVDFSDSVEFPNGSVYRMYYTLSATDSLDFYKGHGDILICRENDLQACQKFVQ
jgi:hypothetical protein